MQPSVPVLGRRHGTNGLSLIQHSYSTIPHEGSILLLVAMWFWLLLVTSAQLPMAQLTMVGMAVYRLTSTPDAHRFTCDGWSLMYFRAVLGFLYWIATSCTSIFVQYMRVADPTSVAIFNRIY